MNTQAARTSFLFRALGEGVDAATANTIADAVVEAATPRGVADAEHWRMWADDAADAAEHIARVVALGDYSMADEAENISAYEDEAGAAGDHTAAMIANIARQHGAGIARHAARHLVGGWEAECRAESAAD